VFNSGACSLLILSQQAIEKLLTDQPNSKTSLLKLGIFEQSYLFNGNIQSEKAAAKEKEKACRG